MCGDGFVFGQEYGKLKLLYETLGLQFAEKLAARNRGAVALIFGEKNQL